MSENVQNWDEFYQKFVHYFREVCYNKNRFKIHIICEHRGVIS